MAKFKVLKKCFFGEGVNRVRLMYPGEIYVSDTLKPSDAPKYFKRITGAEKETITESTGGHTSDETAEMSYHEMKAFVAEQGIEVENQKAATLTAAIAAWKAAQESEQADGSDDESVDETAEVEVENAE